jgi:hypothetical protein
VIMILRCELLSTCIVVEFTRRICSCGMLKRRTIITANISPQQRRMVRIQAVSAVRTHPILHLLRIVQAIHHVTDTLLHALSKFVSIPSISNASHSSGKTATTEPYVHQEDCRQSAVWLRKCLTQLGAEATLVRSHTSITA